MPPAAPTRKREPLEVLITDCFTRQRVVCEYKGEINRKGPEPRYKVYSPFFADPEDAPDDAYRAHRWVPRLEKVLGNAPGERDWAEYRAELQAMAEEAQRAETEAHYRYLSGADEFARRTLAS